MAAEWPMVAIGEVAEVFDGPHATPKTVEHGPIFLGIGALQNGRIQLGETRHVTPEDFMTWTRRVKPEGGDVVFSYETRLGEVASIPEGFECCLGRRMGLVRTDRIRLEPRFFLYQFLSPYFQELIRSRTIPGATVDRIALKEFPSFLIPLPDIEEQRAIAETLGALDDRIDNLSQTNATLQAIAAALFKSWFVDFDGVPPEDMQESELGLIPKGWRVGTLGECCENIRKQARPDALPAGTQYIGLEHMPRKSIALAEWGVSDGLASGKFWYQRNDILFGKLRPYFHKVGVVSHEGVCSTDILVVRAKPLWFGFAAMHLFSDTMISYATQLSNGAKMPRTNWSDIAGYKVALPPLKVTAEFDGAMSPLVEKVHTNVEAAATLAALRDTLLPRLISGQLRIKAAA